MGLQNTEQKKNPWIKSDTKKVNREQGILLHEKCQSINLDIISTLIYSHSFKFQNSTASRFTLLSTRVNKNGPFIAAYI